MKSGRSLLVYLFIFLSLLAVGCNDPMPTMEGTAPSVTGDDRSWLERNRPDPDAIAGRYIIFLDDRLGASEARNISDELAWKAGGRVEYYLKTSRKGFSARLSTEGVARLRSDSRIKRIMSDYRTKVAPRKERFKGRARKDTTIEKSDPGTPTPPPDPTSTQELPWGIARVGGKSDGQGKVCWIVDTGIDLDNTDLTIDVGRSRNFVPDGRSSADDGHGHGTHIAGIIAARDNTFGVVGVAAGATVVSVRVLDNTANGSYAWLLAGLDYIAQNARPGDVVNLSLVGPPEPTIDDAVRRLGDLGIKVVVAAGNYQSDAGNYTPSRVQHQNVYVVTAISEDGCLGWFSNWGNPPVTHAAPGVSILSLAPGGGTVTHTGTSMAAPHVAGLLLVGQLNSDGFACNDPDGAPDPIAHR